MDEPRHAAPRVRKGAQRVHARGPRRRLLLKRAYEEASAADGMRVLVDRLWPRGMSRGALAVDFWLKDVAPSPALRRWYGHEPARWRAFAAKYRAELARRTDLLRLLDELRRRGRVTLVYGARDEARNNAVVLREVIEGRRYTAERARKAPAR
ncbi:MAG: DUF488 family protein [Burkholderiales bacterium]|nr:DUF488 family protein [Burkholderiales bacterium]